MNKRQRKKKWKKETPEEYQRCQQCGNKLNFDDKYHMKYGFCGVSCGMRLYGLFV